MQKLLTAIVVLTNYNYFYNISFSRSLLFSNRDLNCGCLVYMFSLRFSGSKFLKKSWRQFQVRKFFRTQVFAGFAVF